MTSPAKAKIFLSDERGCTESDWFRSYHTFNYGKFQHEHKKPFGELYVLNDDTLAGGRSVALNTEEKALVLLLPVVGAVVCTCNDAETLVNAGELLLLNLDKNEAFELANPYEIDLVNFLQLRIKPAEIQQDDYNSLVAFNLEQDKDQLVRVTANASNHSALFPKISIGKFAGRKEAVYQKSDPQNSLFVFVVQGAFEVQGRLLHARDGLGLWDDPNDTELEALSNDAIVLLIEM